MTRLVVAVLSMVFILASVSAVAEEEVSNVDIDKSLSNLKIGILTYIDYSWGEAAMPDGSDENYDRFSVTRGYFTAQKEINDWLSVRLTTDVMQETKAPGAKLDGSYVLRLKYFYAEFKAPDLGLLTHVKSEVGMGHMPWLDFEEHLNLYRCQGTMAIERAGVFNSADLGASIRGYLGDSLEGADASIGSHYYDGRWGSWHVGIYNGGGYHAEEDNQNKVVEGRVTLRPFPDLVPGLQFSYLGIYGEGNQAKESLVSGVTLDEPPLYQVNLGMVSFQHPVIVVTYQYFETVGNAAGAWIEPDGDGLATSGWSAFLDLRPLGPAKPVHLFGRHDYFDQDADDKWAEDAAYRMTVAGVAFELAKGNLLVLAYEDTDYENDAGLKGKLPVEGQELGDERKYQVVLQVKF